MRDFIRDVDMELALPMQPNVGRLSSSMLRKIAEIANSIDDALAKARRNVGR